MPLLQDTYTQETLKDMEITLKEVTLAELCEGYVNDEERGVRGYGGRLDIRPPYQREFVYGEAKRAAVIDTVVAGFPLNVMYWADREDGTYEIIDGQQRTLSVCQYVHGDFSHMLRYFHSLTADERERFLSYRLSVYLCRGTDSEKLRWFKTINIAGEELTDQELRNAVYAGTWLADAKRHFSRTGCPAYGLAAKYLKGSPIRQDYLETAIRWVSRGNIDVYMSNHQRDPNANALWLHFQSVVNWVKATFPVYRKEMRGLDWGTLYVRHGGKLLDAAAIEAEVKRLMEDVDVTRKSGVYAYVLDRDERTLQIRAFDSRMRREAYERQGGVCPCCSGHFEMEKMEADHITPWSRGGQTIASNCQMLCRDCNRRKSAK